MDLKTCILDSIPKGKNNRISRVDLFRKLQARGFLVGLKDDRPMREAIEELRFTVEGAAICSSRENGGGYWFGTQSEVREWTAQQKRMAVEMVKRANYQRRCADMYYQQAGLF